MSLIIYSGGQTGVDRAALDVAMKLNIPFKGWCPKGRLAEDGIIDKKYHLWETSSPDPSERTIRNILESDATIILSQMGYMDQGTKLTLDLLIENQKAYQIINLIEPSPGKIIDWINDEKISILNIAGPRESNLPGIYEKSRHFLTELLEDFKTTFLIL